MDKECFKEICRHECFYLFGTVDFDVLPVYWIKNFGLCHFNAVAQDKECFHTKWDNTDCRSHKTWCNGTTVQKLYFQTVTQAPVCSLFTIIGLQHTDHKATWNFSVKSHEHITSGSRNGSSNQTRGWRENGLIFPWSILSSLQTRFWFELPLVYWSINLQTHQHVLPSMSQYYHRMQAFSRVSRHIWTVWYGTIWHLVSNVPKLYMGYEGRHSRELQIHFNHLCFFNMHQHNVADKFFLRFTSMKTRPPQPGLNPVAWPIEGFFKLPFKCLTFLWTTLSTFTTHVHCLA